jgi:hypothetical protein
MCILCVFCSNLHSPHVSHVRRVTSRASSDRPYATNVRWVRMRMWAARALVSRVPRVASRRRTHQSRVKIARSALTSPCKEREHAWTVRLARTTQFSGNNNVFCAQRFVALCLKSSWDDRAFVDSAGSSCAFSFVGHIWQRDRAHYMSFMPPNDVPECARTFVM